MYSSAQISPTSMETLRLRFRLEHQFGLRMGNLLSSGGLWCFSNYCSIGLRPLTKQLGGLVVVVSDCDREHRQLWRDATLLVDEGPILTEVHFCMGENPSAEYHPAIPWPPYFHHVHTHVHIYSPPPNPRDCAGLLHLFRYGIICARFALQQGFDPTRVVFEIDFFSGVH